MVTSTLTLQVKVAWWLIPCIRAMAFMCLLLDCRPNMAFVDRLIKMAVTVRPPQRSFWRVLANRDGSIGFRLGLVAGVLIQPILIAAQALVAVLRG